MHYIHAEAVPECIYPRWGRARMQYIHAEAVPECIISTLRPCQNAYIHAGAVPECIYPRWGRVRMHIHDGAVPECIYPRWGRARMHISTMGPCQNAYIHAGAVPECIYPRWGRARMHISTLGPCQNVYIHAGWCSILQQFASGRSLGGLTLESPSWSANHMVSHGSSTLKQTLRGSSLESLLLPQACSINSSHLEHPRKQ